MSFLVTRPPRPVPSICAGSIPCSAAIRATTGETKWCSAGAAAVAGMRRRGLGGGASGCSFSGASRTPPSADAIAASAAACVAGSGGGSGWAPARPRVRPRAGAVAADPGEHRPDLDRLALLHEDLEHDP